jgi:hypothetical protein
VSEKKPDDEHPLVVPMRSSAAVVLGIVGIVALLIGSGAVYILPRFWAEALPDSLRFVVFLVSGVLGVSLWLWLQRWREAKETRPRIRRRTRRR